MTPEEKQLAIAIVIIVMFIGLPCLCLIALTFLDEDVSPKK